MISGVHMHYAPCWLPTLLSDVYVEGTSKASQKSDMIVRLLVVFVFPRMRPWVLFQNVTWRQEYCKCTQNITYVLGSQQGAQIKMASDFRPPEQLSLEGNPPENWRRWRQRFELYLLAKEAHEKDDKIKIAMLLSAIGPEALERYNHFTWPEPVEGDEERRLRGRSLLF